MPWLHNKILECLQLLILSAVLSTSAPPVDSGSQISSSKTPGDFAPRRQPPFLSHSITEQCINAKLIYLAGYYLDLD